MTTDVTLFKTVLQEDYENRKKLNPRFSIRAYALYLGVDSSSLSKTLSNTRDPSEQFIEKVMRKLNLPLQAAETIHDDEIVYLSPREFKAISSWEHFAVIDLVTLKNFQYNYGWMSSKLGIKEVDCRIVTERLLTLGLLREEDGTLVKTAKSFSNHADHTTTVTKKDYQRQLLMKAIQAIDNCASEEKDITSITIAGDPRRMDLAREKIKKFRRELCAFMEGGDKTEVLHLTIQLCPANTTRKEGL